MTSKFLEHNRILLMLKENRFLTLLHHISFKDKQNFQLIRKLFILILKNKNIYTWAIAKKLNILDKIKFKCPLFFYND